MLAVITTTTMTTHVNVCFKIVSACIEIIGLTRGATVFSIVCDSERHWSYSCKALRALQARVCYFVYFYIVMMLTLTINQQRQSKNLLGRLHQIDVGSLTFRPDIFIGLGAIPPPLLPPWIDVTNDDDDDSVLFGSRFGSRTDVRSGVSMRTRGKVRVDRHKRQWCRRTGLVAAFPSQRMRSSDERKHDSWSDAERLPVITCVEHFAPRQMHRDCTKTTSGVTGRTSAPRASWITRITWYDGTETRCCMSSECPMEVDSVQLTTTNDILGRQLDNLSAYKQNLLELTPTIGPDHLNLTDDDVNLVMQWLFPVRDLQRSPSTAFYTHAKLQFSKMNVHCVSKKRHPFYICYNLIRCHPILSTLGRNILQEIWNKQMHREIFIACTWIVTQRYSDWPNFRN